MILLFNLLFRILVIFHLFIVFGVAASVFVIPFYTEWYIWIPMGTLIIRLASDRNPCVLTYCENKLRTKLGYNKIDGFIKYYITGPVYRKYLNYVGDKTAK